MKRFFLFLFLIYASGGLQAQKGYWQQEVNFDINVSLNDKDHTLEAFESVEYINNSPDTLSFIWFHIWPNAYKNDRTAFSEQLLKERRTDFYFSKAEDKGYINQLDFKVDNTNAQSVVDTNNIDIIKVLLPKPLPPGGKTTISTPFKVKLPYNFSRGGHVGKSYQITQWFPKPAVYDRKGWHPMPYLDQGEFYSEFGKYDVEITAPSEYVIAGTGMLQDAETLQELKEKGKHTIEGKTKTWHYKQDNIHDFAWFASRYFLVKYDTAQLASGKVVDVFSYYREKSKGWDKSLAYAKEGLRKYSSWIGDYPYSTATVVQGSKNENSGGMEYPTITLITTQQTGQELDATIVHEIGHNWFYGALASNERIHPWMDEGMNTFYQKRYEDEKYHSYGYLKGTPFSLDNKMPDDEEQMLLKTMAKLEKDQPIETTSEEFTSTNYGIIAYYKASRWLKKLETELGKEEFNRAMHKYYSDYRFKHPYPEDFRASIESTTGKNLEIIFSLLQQTGPLELNEKKSLKPSFFFNANSRNNYINFAPFVGYNHYDKLMPGVAVHNFQLPLAGVQYLAGVMYGTGSKKLNGFGRVSYNVYRRKYHLTTALSYIKYSQDDFKVDDKTKLIMGVERLTPSINLTFFDKDLNSTKRYTGQWKTSFIKEGNLDFNTITTPTDTTDVVSVVSSRYYINRLTLGVSDNRVLFPYSFNLTADQGKDFIRLGLTGNYFFNYSANNAGLSARFFAGKFFYLTNKTFVTRFNNDRYHLNLSAPKGYEDYTYSDYFIGRNEFEGWMSQQVMERDGFFKVNTELLGNKVGKTDDWLMSLNLVSDLGKQNLPVKLFLDVGTYAEAWKDNPASGRFVYDAGVQVSLLNSLVNVYVPLLYSKVYSDYYKSTITEKRFLKTIAFSINIRKLQVRDLVKDIPL